MKWTEYPDMGCFYRLNSGGELEFSPMMEDDQRTQDQIADDSGVVDFEMLEGDYLGEKLITDRLHEIEAELKEKYGHQ